MEDTTVTSGSPAGCSVGDTTGTKVGDAGTVLSTTQKQDGSKAAYIATGEDGFDFGWDSSTSAIVNTSSGKVDFWFYTTNDANAGDLWSMGIDAGNRIWIFIDANKYVCITHNAGGTGSTARTSFPVYASDGWYHVVCQWDATAHGGLYTRCGCDQTDGTGNSADNGTNALGTWSGTSGTMRVGDRYVGSTGPTYIDNLKVYNAW